MYRSKGSGWLKHCDFMLLDAFWIIVSLALACLLRHGTLTMFAENFYKTLLLLYPLIHMFLVLFYSAYRSVLSRGYFQELRATVVHNVLIFLVVILYMFLNKNTDFYSRIIVCLTLLFSVLLMYASRIVLKKLILRTRGVAGNSNIKILVITDSKSAESTVSTMLDHNLHALNLCGVVINDKDMIGSDVCGIPVVCSADTWKDYLLSNVVDEVFVNLDDQQNASEYIKYIISVGITAHYVLRTDIVDAPFKMVQGLNGFSVVSASLNIASTRQRIVKRAIDIFFGLIGALAVILLTIVIGPLIYLEDRGPIFFTQKRVGRNGRVFRIFKFRTMYTDAEERKAELMQQNEMSGHIFKMKNDPRITRIGRFLRKTSIDELPQAFNILFGSMSVVGTRPPTLDEYLQYEPHHKVRLGITPGLTGLWQVSGRNEISDFDEIVRLDEQYIRQWSLTLDLKIILKTFIVVLKGDGAE